MLREIAAVAAAAGLLAAAGPTSHKLEPLPTGYTRTTPPAKSGRFRFVVGGDNRSSGNGDPMPPALAEICREVGLLGPDLVLWTGDTIHGYDDTPAQAASEYGTFLKSAALCRVPFFNIPGNHEKGTDGASLERVYQQRMGKLYGSFGYGNSHFIGLDTTQLQPGGKHVAEVGAAQMRWLEEDLRAHAGTAENTFVFMHHYVFGPPDPDLADGKDTGFAETATRDQLHQLFARYGVRAVFCGHSHLYWHADRDGVAYYIAGNAGAPLEAAPEAGGFLGYLLVDVDGRQIHTRTLQPWTLLQRTMPGGKTGSNHAEVTVSNYNHYDLPVRGVSVQMPASAHYRAVGSIRYKGKTTAVPVEITGVRHLTANRNNVSLSLVAPHARTVHVRLDVQAR